jgi:fructose-1-phosphate kinase PfkB-like protein
MAFNMVAMALSGYTVEKEALWRQMCRKLCTEVSPAQEMCLVLISGSLPSSVIKTYW